MGRGIYSISLDEETSKIADDLMKEGRGALSDFVKKALTDHRNAQLDPVVLRMHLAETDRAMDELQARKSFLLKNLKRSEELKIAENQKVINEESNKSTPQEKRIQWIRDIIESKGKYLSKEERLELEQLWAKSNYMPSRFDFFLKESGYYWSDIDEIRKKVSK